MNNYLAYSLLYLILSAFFSILGIFFLNNASRFQRTVRSIGTKRRNNWFAWATFILAVAFFALALGSRR